MNAPSKIVGVRELRGNLSGYLRRLATGESFDIVSRGKKIGELRAPSKERDDWPSSDPKSPNFRKPGAMKGKIWMADDWDSWSEEELAAFDGPLFPDEE